MRGLSGFIGIGCFLAGIYGLRRKIILTTGSPFFYSSRGWWYAWWYGIAAADTILLALAGLLGLSGILVVFSGRAIQLPMTLFEFLSFGFLMAIGIKLFLNSTLSNRTFGY
ncbi:MAG: hypothetical protein ACUVR8_13470 [Acidobacteriota bacterium]